MKSVAGSESGPFKKAVGGAAVVSIAKPPRLLGLANESIDSSSCKKLY
jgi:hypothetical protein